MNWEKIKLVFWGAIIGAIVLAIVGFTWGGWVTSSTAEKGAEDAVLVRLAPICVEQSKRDPEGARKLEELKKEESWKRADYVKKQGWATMPGEKNSHSKVAESCAELLVKRTQ